MLWERQHLAHLANQTLEKRRLSAPNRAHDRNELALTHGEADVVDHERLLLSPLLLLRRLLLRLGALALLALLRGLGLAPLLFCQRLLPLECRALNDERGLLRRVDGERRALADRRLENTLQAVERVPAI
jgi:hypothetical protein